MLIKFISLSIVLLISGSLFASSNKIDGKYICSGGNFSKPIELYINGKTWDAKINENNLKEEYKKNANDSIKIEFNIGKKDKAYLLYLSGSDENGPMRNTDFALITYNSNQDNLTLHTFMGFPAEATCNKF